MAQSSDESFHDGVDDGRRHEGINVGTVNSNDDENGIETSLYPPIIHDSNLTDNNGGRTKNNDQDDKRNLQEDEEEVAGLQKQAKRFGAASVVREIIVPPSSFVQDSNDNHESEGNQKLVFEVPHQGGVHFLWMYYHSPTSRPLRMSINRIPMNTSVAFLATSSSSSSHSSSSAAAAPAVSQQQIQKHGKETSDWYNEGAFDLGPYHEEERQDQHPYIATIEFSPIFDGQWPVLEKFKLIPERRNNQQYFQSSSCMEKGEEFFGSQHPPYSYRSNDEEEDGVSSLSQAKSEGNQQKSRSGSSDRHQNHHHPSDTGSMPPSWKLKSPTAVTFTFEIGLPLNSIIFPPSSSNDNGQGEHNYEYVNVNLRGKFVKFTYGEAHDCLVINGDPIGNPYGGDNFPKVTYFGEEDYIHCMTLGLSTYSGEAAFHGVVIGEKDAFDKSTKKVANRKKKNQRTASSLRGRQSRRNPTKRRQHTNNSNSSIIRNNQHYFGASSSIRQRENHSSIEGNDEDDDDMFQNDSLSQAFATARVSDQSKDYHSKYLKRLLVGAQHDGPTWTYDRQHLGLNLWITSICAPDNSGGRPIGRYGFTLSSDPNLIFNPAAFEEFWNWFVSMKQTMVMNSTLVEGRGDSSCKDKQEQTKHDNDDTMGTNVPTTTTTTTKASLREEWKAQYGFLRDSFAGRYTKSNDYDVHSWMYGTNRHICIVFDVFSLTIYRFPHSSDYKVTMFIDGEPFNYDPDASIEEIPLLRNHILAHAITTAAHDTDLLYQMGLIRDNDDGDDDKEGNKGECWQRELECLPYLDDRPLFPKEYPTNNDDKSDRKYIKNDVFFKPNPMARKVMIVLAIAGLRKAGSTMLVEDTFGWDIYSLSSFIDPNASSLTSILSPSSSSLTKQKSNSSSSISVSSAQRRRLLMDWLLLVAAAFFCLSLQLLVPILLIYRAWTMESEDELTWDTYVVRILFLCYNALSEYKTAEIDRDDRITGWLCFFPEHSTNQLILGRIVNKASKLVTTAAQIGVLLTSYTVIDVTLNSLALNFITELDDMLVNDTSLNMLRQYHETDLIRIKAELAIQYRQMNDYDDPEEGLPKIQELPARYFLLFSRRSTDFAMCTMFVALIYMIISPWITWITTTSIVK